MKKSFYMLLTAGTICALTACGSAAPAQTPAETVAVETETVHETVQTEATETEALAVAETEIPKTERSEASENTEVAEQSFAKMLDNSPGFFSNNNSLSLPGSTKDSTEDGDSDDYVGDDSYLGGDWIDNTYYNYHLDLSITITDDYKPIDNKMIESFQKECDPYVYIDNGFVSDKCAVLIQAEDLFAQGIDVTMIDHDAMMEFMKSQLEKYKEVKVDGYDTEVIEDITEDTINDVTYYGVMVKMLGKLPSSQDMIRYDVYALSGDGYLYQILINAADEETLGEILGFIGEEE